MKIFYGDLIYHSWKCLNYFCELEIAKKRMNKLMLKLAIEGNWTKLMKHMLWCSIDFQWKLLQIVFDCIYNNQCYIVKVCTISVVVSMIFISYVMGVKMQPTLPSTGSNFTPLWSSDEWRRRNFHETPFLLPIELFVFPMQIQRIKHPPCLSVSEILCGLHQHRPMTSVS